MPGSPNLGITHVDPNQANKAATINESTDWMDAVVAGVLTRGIGGTGNVTLTSSPIGGDAANSKIILTGTRSGNGNIIFPALTRIWRVINNTTGAYTMTLKGPSGSGVSSVPGDDFFIRFDGVNMIREYIAPYVLGIQGVGIPVPGIAILRHRFTLTVIFRAGLPHASFKAGAAATASAVFDIQKNGASIGSMTFAGSGTVPTFTFSSDRTFVVDDELEIFPPGSADATLADICGTIQGER